MRRDAPFVEGETYHLFNRGAHKQKIFTKENDYTRFLLLLHLANTEEKLDLRETFRKYKGQTFATIFKEEQPTKSLVDVFAYALMPNHFHLVLKQKKEGGITAFTRKVLTGYSMYFNLLYDHSGILSQGAIKSRAILNEAYFRYIFAYIHLNPLSLTHPGWEKDRTLLEAGSARKSLNNYRYSSFYDYSLGARPERAILSYAEAPDFLKDQNDLEELLRWHSNELAKV